MQVPALTDLRNPETREAFYVEALGQTGSDGLNALLQYHEDLVEQMDASGAFEHHDDAVTTAAQTVFGGVARAMRENPSERSLYGLDQMDHIIRKHHQLREVEFPDQHPDPLVAAFYTELSPHLLKALPGDRVDGWRR
jgi:hypothetical protein